MTTAELTRNNIPPSIRPATIADAARLAEIHIFGWRAAYQDLISEEYLFASLSVYKRVASLAKALDPNLSEKPEETWVCERGLAIQGFMTVGSCRDDDKPDGFELMGLYMDPLLRRRGSGSALVVRCEELARQRGYREIFLWVLAENHPARRFYEQAGYQPEGKSQLLEKFGLEEVRYVKLL
ncbi:MAG: GNAT family N-acetyltransferase [Spirochaetes bacterium]|nr:GNAT family N-acetyltransferase [Spirochaetota bacterium]MBU0957042.1 GNAT family N-acetyltransferase [Spirochaetota bacterium]